MTSLVAAVVGLWVADAVVDGVDTQLSGFITAVVIFVVAQAVLSPFILKMAHKYAKALQSGVALIVWLASALAGSILLTFITKERAGDRDYRSLSRPGCRACG